MPRTGCWLKPDHMRSRGEMAQQTSRRHHRCASSPEDVPGLGLFASPPPVLAPEIHRPGHISHHRLPLPISAELLLPSIQRWEVEKLFKAVSAFLLFCCYCSRFLRMLRARSSAKKAY